MTINNNKDFSDLINFHLRDFTCQGEFFNKNVFELLLGCPTFHEIFKKYVNTFFSLTENIKNLEKLNISIS